MQKAILGLYVTYNQRNGNNDTCNDVQKFEIIFYGEGFKRN